MSLLWQAQSLNTLSANRGIKPLSKALSHTPDEVNRASFHLRASSCCICTCGNGKLCVIVGGVSVESVCDWGILSSEFWNGTSCLQKNLVMTTLCAWSHSVRTWRKHNAISARILRIQPTMAKPQEVRSQGFFLFPLDFLLSTSVSECHWWIWRYKKCK